MLCTRESLEGDRIMVAFVDEKSLDHLLVQQHNGEDGEGHHSAIVWAPEKPSSFLPFPLWVNAVLVVPQRQHLVDQRNTL